MVDNSLSKINRLSAPVKERISQEDILSELDSLDENFGVKSTIILVDLLLGDLNYSDLSDFLQKNYGFNQFLADQIKADFGELIENIGRTLSSVKVSTDSSINNSKLTFSREDEEEVKRYREVSINSTAPINYEAHASNIVGSLNLESLDEVLIKRLQNIIVARLKDVRDDLETRDNLIRSTKVGGMGFSESDADSILRTIKDYDLDSSASIAKKINLSTEQITPEITKPSIVNKKESEPDISIEEEDGLPVIKTPNNKVPMDLSSELPAVATPTKETLFKKQLPQSSQNAKIEVGVKVSTQEAKLSTSFNKLPPPNPAPYVSEKTIPDTVLNSKTANKPNLDDVRFEKRLMGPIEELANMTLIDFRRMAADPKISVNKVKEKIDLLESEGFNKKMEGIKAWHSNEVNRFYRLLGQAAMTEGKSIEDIIKERLLSGKPTLSIDELHSVIELNRALRF